MKICWRETLKAIFKTTKSSNSKFCTVLLSISIRYSWHEEVKRAMTFPLVC
jgi:hypothetical protein